MTGGRRGYEQVAMVAEPRILALYQDLRRVNFDPQEKPSLSENLTDILEILAVAQGIKPSHLNGHGLRSERLLRDLEPVACRHGLLTCRTRPHAPYWHRPPNIDAEYLAWQTDVQKRQAASSPDVLWVYQDPAIEASIERLVAGNGEEAETFGYPSCCVNARADIAARMMELLVAAYKTQHGAKSVQDLIRSSEQDLGVTIDQPIHLLDDESKQKFPFVQFTACDSCIDRVNSPAAQLNSLFHQLAREVDELFAKQIERAVAEPLAIARPNQALQARAAEPLECLPPLDLKPTYRVGRNDPCPCGSGLKFKKCHGRRSQ